jgi:hypothetical protein
MNEERAACDAVLRLMGDYFDGLYRSDTALLRTVFHPLAQYACATDGALLQLSIPDYFDVVDRRPSPSAKGESRRDRVISIDFAGPATAFVRAECRIAPKSFIDLLTLVQLGGRWQIVSKVFHYDLDTAPS